MKPKYYFTQLSAPIVGLGVMFCLLALAGIFHVIETDDIGVVDMAIISLIFLSVPISMVLWGKILVMLGILTKHEARGYPWSKPWKKSRIID